MKKLTHIALALFAAATAWASEPAAETKQNPNQLKLSVSEDEQTSTFGAPGSFAAALYVSVQDPSMEWWYKLPATATPHISQLRKIYINEKFSLFPFFENAAVKDDKFKITYSVQMTDPAGKKTAMIKDAVFEGTKPSKDVILAAPDVLEVKLDQRYAEGVYRFEMTAKDDISGETSVAENHIRLTAWTPSVPFTDKKMLNDFIYSYYLQPSPDTLYSIFFSELLDLEQKDSPNSLNYTLIGFFRAAFDDNRFLLWPIRQEFANASELDKAKIIFLFAITGEDPVDESLLSDYEKDYQKRIRNADFVDPYKEWDAVVGATQVDALWGEFFARGTYKPLRRIMDLFKYSGEASYAESMLEKNKKPESPEDWRKFMLGMLNKAAMVTFAQNAYRIPLVENYCMWAIQNNDLPKISYKALSPLFNEIDENNAEQGGKETIWRIGTPKIFMPEKVSE